MDTRQIASAIVAVIGIVGHKGSAFGTLLVHIAKLQIFPISASTITDLAALLQQQEKPPNSDGYLKTGL